MVTFKQLETSKAMSAQPHSQVASHSVVHWQIHPADAFSAAQGRECWAAVSKESIQSALQTHSQCPLKTQGPLAGLCLCICSSLITCTRTLKTYSREKPHHETRSSQGLCHQKMSVQVSPTQFKTETTAVLIPLASDHPLTHCRNQRFLL